MGRELETIRRKKAKLLKVKADMETEILLLSKREEELENQEVVAIFRKADITLEELMESFNKRKREEKKITMMNMEEETND